MTDRACKRCQKSFPSTTEFFTPSNGGRNLDIYCRECRKEYARAWYSKNKEKEVARSSDWNKKNPEKVALNMRKCRQRRPDHYKEYMREYRRKNVETFRINDKKKHAKRRCAISNTKHKLTKAQYIAAKKAANGFCYYCKIKATLTLDHITPLSKGGAHSRDNIVFACSSCNSSKGARDPIAFAQSKGLLLP